MVACIMLTADRPAMAARAIRSFLAQTYERKRLYIWDTSTVLLDVIGACGKANTAQAGVEVADLISAPLVARERFVGATIGRLRNAANKYALAHYTTENTRPEVLIHWDDDDYSHPKRIKEQVELLTTGAAISNLGGARRALECVGYNDVIFWDTRTHWEKFGPPARPDPYPTAWRFRSVDPRYVIGSSMCYWADAWRSDPFDDAVGEDVRWWRRHAALSRGVPADGRLICSIHGGNTSAAYSTELMRGSQWQRVQEFDDYVRERMKL